MSCRDADIVFKIKDYLFTCSGHTLFICLTWPKSQAKLADWD